MRGQTRQASLPTGRKSLYNGNAPPPEFVRHAMTPQPLDPYTAEQWRAEEKAYVLHTWTAQSQWNAPTVMGGSGAWFWDDQGRRYLDLSAMAECSHLGHQHPAVVAAIKRQADEIMFVTSGWGNRTRAMLAKKTVEHARM